MTRKKQILIPSGILVIGVLSMIAFSSLKKPPEEKEKVDTRPIVSIANIKLEPMTLEVNSYGIVKPKYETELVAQVSGEIVELSDVFVRGGFVNKGQLLARIDPNDYEAALIDAQSNMASARAALETEQAQGQVAEQEWKKITDSSPTELSLRKPQLAQELARVKSAQAAILRANRNVERTELRAPFDAMIDSRQIGLGSFVGVGSAVGTLLGTAIAEVRLPVADNQLQFLAGHGQSAKVNLKGMLAGKDVQWSAKIARSEGVIDSKSRMSYLVAEVVDPYGLSSEKEQLRFGTYVNAEILGVEIQSASAIPRYLVNQGRVAVLDADSTLRYMPIDIVRQQGAQVIISGGLSQGAQLIVSALDYPADGMKLVLQSNTVAEQKSDTETETQIASAKD